MVRENASPCASSTTITVVVEVQGRCAVELGNMTREKGEDMRLVVSGKEQVENVGEKILK